MNKPTIIALPRRTKLELHPDYEEIKQLIADDVDCHKISKVLRERYPTDKSKWLIHSYLYIQRAKLFPHLAEKHKKKRPTEKMKKTEITLEEEEDIATKIMRLTGREPPPPMPRKEFTDEQLLSWVEGVKGISKFVEDLIIERGEHVKLQDYQVEMVEKFLENNRVCICAAGQIGKDFMMQNFSLHWAITHPGSTQMVVCATHGQSVALMNRTLMAIKSSEDLLATFVDKRIKPEPTTYFTNESKIMYLTAKSAIAGFTNIDIIYVNEARDIREEEVMRVSPLLGIGPVGKLFVLSRPLFRRGYFWECYQNPVFETMNIPTEWNEFFSKEQIEIERATRSPEYFRSEFLAEFADAGSSYFSEKAINECSKIDYDFKSMVAEKDYVYSLGIDPARLHDTAAMIVVGQHENEKHRPRYKVAHVWGFSPDKSEPSTFAHQYAYIGLLNDKFHFGHVVPEKTGMGGPYAESLQVKWLEAGWSPRIIEPYDTGGIPQKLMLYDFCKQVIETRDIKMPRSAFRLLNELKLTQFGASPTGKPRVETPITDDYSDALCLALIAFKKPFEIGVATARMPSLHPMILTRRT